MNRNHTTATTEDMLDSLPYYTFEDEDVYPDEEFVRKADVARLLATTRTATIEDVAQVINEVLGGDMDNHARIAAHRLADAGLLATARTRPTREQIAEHLRKRANDDEDHADRLDAEGGPSAEEWDRWYDEHLTVSHQIDGKSLRIEGRPEAIADAVLALLRGGA